MNDLEQIEHWAIQSAITTWTLLACASLILAALTLALGVYVVSGWLIFAGACMAGAWVCCVVKLFRLRARLALL